MIKKLKNLKDHLFQTGRMMIGLPDYERYVEHMRAQHPDQYCMTYEEFFRERQQARYSGKSSGKCC
jgi:uncharacterized short protein YbdD (DUF466 family)